VMRSQEDCNLNNSSITEPARMTRELTFSSEISPVDDGKNASAEEISAEEEVTEGLFSKIK